ncbi:hypothetical protein BCR34DRAFT_604547 [Clohesyomyces aquaticus]|uniref:Uncharacterized protein n=1 Tax=Clohesyomyces aquaticus TaxID=1231657 RepID=A0A1Y1Z567_9PLEO|nr:hypothetical protein BCR34DRAFT_604547 [Clohesyomyces aquaticus]
MAKHLLGITYGIYCFLEIRADSGYISHITTALNDISGLYSAFLGDNSLEVEIHLVERSEKGNSTELATTITPGFPSGCYIGLGTNSRDGLEPENAFKATVAYEMYHCVQQRLDQRKATDAQKPYRKWWREGSATSMSNHFYSDVSAETGSINFCDPQQPIFAEENAYGAGVVFQYFSNGYSESAAAELSRIAKDDDIVDALPGISAKFVDQEITWESGALVRPFNVVPTTIFTVFEAPLSDQLVSVPPFQIKRLETMFARDKQVSMIFTPDESDYFRTIPQYRKGNSGAYDTAKPGEKIDLTEYG